MTATDPLRGRSPVRVVPPPDLFPSAKRMSGAGPAPPASPWSHHGEASPSALSTTYPLKSRPPSGGGGRREVLTPHVSAASRTADASTPPAHGVTLAAQKSMVPGGTPRARSRPRVRPPGSSSPERVPGRPHSEIKTTPSIIVGSVKSPVRQRSRSRSQSASPQSPHQPLSQTLPAQPYAPRPTAVAYPSSTGPPQAPKAYNDVERAVDYVFIEPTNLNEQPRYARQPVAHSSTASSSVVSPRAPASPPSSPAAAGRGQAREVRREILGLEEQKAQAIRDEDFLEAERLKREIATLMCDGHAAPTANPPHPRATASTTAAPAATQTPAAAHPRHAAPLEVSTIMAPTRALLYRPGGYAPGAATAAPPPVHVSLIELMFRTRGAGGSSNYRPRPKPTSSHAAIKPGTENDLECAASPSPSPAPAASHAVDGAPPGSTGAMYMRIDPKTDAWEVVRCEDVKWLAIGCGDSTVWRGGGAVPTDAGRCVSLGLLRTPAGSSAYDLEFMSQTALEEFVDAISCCSPHITRYDKREVSVLQDVARRTSVATPQPQYAQMPPRSGYAAAAVRTMSPTRRPVPRYV